MQEVTIVIPVYNRAEYLPRLFRSLLTLTYKSVRVILVDNGSEDQSLLLCQQFAEEAWFPVEVLEEKAKGASKARNAGLNACTTPWVYFFDSDDELSSDFLDLVIPLCEGRDAVFLPTCQVQGAKEYVRPFKVTAEPGYQILSLMLNSPSMLLRTEWLKGIGGWDADLSVWDDWELGIRVLLNHPRYAWYNRKAFHKLYVHDISITGPSMSHNLEGKMDCLKTIYAQLESNDDRKAFYLRTKIIEGTLRAEGTLKTLSGFDAEMSDATIWMGRFLSFYTRWGGRGAWRLAIWFCQKS